MQASGDVRAWPAKVLPACLATLMCGESIAALQATGGLLAGLNAVPVVCMCSGATGQGAGQCQRHGGRPAVAVQRRLIIGGGGRAGQHVSRLAAGAEPAVGPSAVCASQSASCRRLHTLPQCSMEPRYDWCGLTLLEDFDPWRRQCRAGKTRAAVIRFKMSASLGLDPTRPAQDALQHIDDDVGYNMSPDDPDTGRGQQAVPL